MEHLSIARIRLLTFSIVLSDNIQFVFLLRSASFNSKPDLSFNIHNCLIKQKPISITFNNQKCKASNKFPIACQFLASFSPLKYLFLLLFFIFFSFFLFNILFYIFLFFLFFLHFFFIFFLLTFFKFFLSFSFFLSFFLYI